MKRAFRYNGEDMDNQIPNYINKGNSAINYIKNIKIALLQKTVL